MKKIAEIIFIICSIILVWISIRSASVFSEKNKEFQEMLKTSELTIQEDQKQIKALEEKNKELEESLKQAERVKHKFTEEKILRYESGGLPAAAPPPSIVMNPDKKNSGTQRGENDQENIIVPMDSTNNSCATCIDQVK